MRYVSSLILFIFLIFDFFFFKFLNMIMINVYRSTPFEKNKMSLIHELYWMIFTDMDISSRGRDRRMMYIPSHW